MNKAKTLNSSMKGQPKKNSLNKFFPIRNIRQLKNCLVKPGREKKLLDEKIKATVLKLANESPNTISLHDFSVKLRKAGAKMAVEKVLYDLKITDAKKRQRIGKVMEEIDCQLTKLAESGNQAIVDKPFYEMIAGRERFESDLKRELGAIDLLIFSKKYEKALKYMSARFRKIMKGPVKIWKNQKNHG